MKEQHSLVKRKSSTTSTKVREDGFIESNSEDEKIKGENKRKSTPSAHTLERSAAKEKHGIAAAASAKRHKSAA